jgi:hypothetical protein
VRLLRSVAGPCRNIRSSVAVAAPWPLSHEIDSNHRKSIGESKWRISLDLGQVIAFSSEVDTGSREENASK